MLRKRDGSRVNAIRQPDGSWFETPAPDDTTFAVRIPLPEITLLSAQPLTSGNVRQFLREIGKRGGQARARRHSRDELAAFGRVRRKTKSGV